MKLFIRILQSIQNGSFAFKLLNRISPNKYIPGSEMEIDQYIAKHYPHGDKWKSLSPSARKVWVQFYPLFDKYQIKTIFYVGAHIGETALSLNEAFPGREFYLFEPVPQSFNILAEKTKQYENMQCFNIAVGSKEEYGDMFVDEFSPASSLLPYKAIALQEYPFLGKQHSVKVHVKPLDTLMNELNIGNVDLLLMDVQGYENEVLMGAQEKLQSCKVIISEMSLQALYHGSSIFDSIYQTLVHKGFQLQYFINPMQGSSKQILQIDGIFVREYNEGS